MPLGDVRELDMQASPYDLADLGYAPVPIESPERKADYARRQRGLSERAAPLRRTLPTPCEQVLGQGRSSGPDVATRGRRPSPLAASAARTAISPG